jgi:hypothetical protein
MSPKQENSKKVKRRRGERRGSRRRRIFVAPRPDAHLSHLVKKAVTKKNK